MPTAMVNGAEIYYEEAGRGPPIILSAGGLQGTLAGYGPVRSQCSRRLSSPGGTLPILIG